MPKLRRRSCQRRGTGATLWLPSSRACSARDGATRFAPCIRTGARMCGHVMPCHALPACSKRAQRTPGLRDYTVDPRGRIDPSRRGICTSVLPAARREGTISRHLDTSPSINLGVWCPPTSHNTVGWGVRFGGYVAQPIMQPPPNPKKKAQNP